MNISIELIDIPAQMNNGSSNLSNSDLHEKYILNIVNLYVNDLLGSIIFVIGILFNLLSFTYFQLSRSFHDTSMRHYLSVLSITDTLRLSEWFFLFLLNKKVIFMNQFMCRSFLYIHITSGNISVWLLVFLSIERYIILRFPFKGKQFYTTRNSLRTLCAVILILIIVDIPYLLPNFVVGTFIDYELNLHMCITNPEAIYRTYMFVNNILFYALIPFVILMVSNCLLISSLARQNSQLFNMLSQNDETIIINQKRERQFKEKTILLISVTFFLVLTVSPRYIAQMIFVYTQHTSLFKVIILKCLFILEMLNFGINFLFYILFSKTSRNELYLIVYYFFCWKWSKDSKKYSICNHPHHNNNDQNNITDYDYNRNLFNMAQKNSKSDINCFLLNASRLKTLRKKRRDSKKSMNEQILLNEPNIHTSSIKKKNNCIVSNANQSRFPG